METRPSPPENRRLLPIFERVEPTNLSHSALQEFKTCPRKYFYSWVLGYKPKETPPYFSFGKAYHKFREVLARRFLERGIIADKEALDEGITAARTIMKKEWRPITNPRHRYAKFNFLDEMRLLNSCMVAYAHWQEEQKKRAIRTIEVEAPFNVEVSSSLGEFSSGRFDAIVEWNGHLWVRDYKTSTTRKDWFERGVEPNDQVERYLFALHARTTKKIMGVLFEVLWNEDKDKLPQIYAVTTNRTAGQLESWQHDQEIYLRQIALCRDSDVWPQNDKACWQCDYHLVCKSMNQNGMVSALKNLAKFAPYDNMEET